MSNNKIKTFEEISKIAQLPEIKNVLFIGNPCYGDKSKEDNAPYVVKRIPQIEMVDGKMISPAVRKQALELEWSPGWLLVLSLLYKCDKHTYNSSMTIHKEKKTNTV